jgi:hypothetical protein
MSSSEASALEDSLNSTDLAIEASEVVAGSGPIELLVVNRGPNPADAVEIHVIPTTVGVSVRDANGETAACRPIGSTTVCDIGPLFAREQRAVTIESDATDSALSGTSVAVVGVGAIDTDPSNNSVTLE